MLDYQVIPMATVTASKLTQYYHWSGCYRKRIMKDESLANLKDNKVKGKISIKSSKSMTTIINNWYSCVYFDMVNNNEDVKKINKRFTFLTLTLSSDQLHDDKFIKRNMLGQFIIMLQRQEKIKNYVHCSEAQSNGNIHFHLLLDKCIPHKNVRYYWNRIQEQNGYIDKFEQKHGHRDPNSTDIHSLNKINNVPAYLVKYFTKDEKRRPIDGRLWGCSDSLRNIEKYSDAIDNQTSEFLEQLKIDTSCHKHYGDYWSIWEYRHMIKYRDTNNEFINRIKDHYVNEYNILNDMLVGSAPTVPRVITAPEKGANSTQAPCAEPTNKKACKQGIIPF